MNILISKKRNNITTSEKITAPDNRVISILKSKKEGWQAERERFLKLKQEEAEKEWSENYFMKINIE